jgi:hypothetical protein
MGSVQQTIVLLLVALWLPASSHAWLQRVGWIHQQHIHEGETHADVHHHEDSHDQHEHDAHNHAAADGACLIPSGKIHVLAPVLAATPAWLQVASLTAPADLISLALHSGLSPPGTSPPELSNIWQFSSRAALPVRAPSPLF